MRLKILLLVEIIRAQDKDPVHHLDAVYPFDKAAGFGHVKPSGYRQRRAVDRADVADNLVGAKFLKGIGGIRRAPSVA